MNGLDDTNYLLYSNSGTVVGITGLNHVAIGDVDTGGLTLPSDFNDLSSLESVVLGDGVGEKDLGQLTDLDSVPLQQLLEVVLRHQLVLRHQFVLGDVDDELLELEELEVDLVLGVQIGNELG